MIVSVNLHTAFTARAANSPLCSRRADALKRHSRFPHRTSVVIDGELQTRRASVDGEKSHVLGYQRVYIPFSEMKTSEENGSYCHGEHHTHTSSPAPGRSFFDRETRRRKNLDWKL